MHEVLRGRPEHGRAAHVDHLDRVFLAGVLAPGDLVERVEVDAHEVDRLDAVLGERRHVVLTVTPGQNPGVHTRMECLDPPAEQLRGLGEIVDAAHGEAFLLEPGRRAAAGEQADTEVGQAAGELGNSPLVVHRHEGASDHRAPPTACAVGSRSRTTRGSRRCSTSWTRSSSDSGVSPASTRTRSWAITGPVSTPSST